MGIIIRPRWMASWKWQAEKTPVPPKRMLIDPPPPFFYIFIFLLGITRQFLQEFHFLFFGYKVTKNNGGREKVTKRFLAVVQLLLTQSAYF